MFLHVMEEALQEWIVDARIIILHICMYRAGFIVQARNLWRKTKKILQDLGTT